MCAIIYTCYTKQQKRDRVFKHTLITSTTNLRHASNNALQQDAGTGDDGNSRRTYWFIAARKKVSHKNLGIRQ